MKPPCAAMPLTIEPIACSRTPKCRLRPAKLMPPSSAPSIFFASAAGAGPKSPRPTRLVNVDGSRSAEPPISDGIFLPMAARICLPATRVDRPLASAGNAGMPDSQSAGSSPRKRAVSSAYSFGKACA